LADLIGAGGLYDVTTDVNVLGTSSLTIDAADGSLFTISLDLTNINSGRRIAGTPDQDILGSGTLWLQAAFCVPAAPVAGQEWRIVLDGIESVHMVDSPDVGDLTHALAGKITSDYVPVVSGATVTFTVPWTLDPDTGQPLVPDPGDEYFYAPFNPNIVVVEELQVDTLNVFNGQSLASDTATLTESTLTGMGMGPETAIAGRFIPGGITYGNLEVIDLRLGIKGDDVTVESTHLGATRIDTGGGIDAVRVKTVSGHTTIDTGAGADVTTVSSAEDLLDPIAGLLTVNGAGEDTLTVDDGGDANDNVGVLTGTTLTDLGMGTVSEVQSVFVRAASGTFKLRAPGLGLGSGLPDLVAGHVRRIEGFGVVTLDFTQDAADTQARLAELYGSPDVRVSLARGNVGTTYRVSFVRDMAGIDQAELQWGESRSGGGDLPLTGLVPDPDASVDVKVTTVRDGTTEPQLNTVQVLTVDAITGTFRIHFPLADNTGHVHDRVTGAIAAGATAGQLLDALSAVLNPNNTNNALPHTDNVAVAKFGNVYHITFQSDHADLAIDPVDIDTAALDGTLTIETRRVGISYYGVETLNVDLGSGDDVFNVRGTSAVTNLNLGDGDERIYVSSQADPGLQTTTDFLRGHLDDVAGTLNIDAGRGSHELMISDEAAVEGDTNVLITDTPAPAKARDATLGDTEMYVIGLAGGAITYRADDAAGDFAKGISIWSGFGADVFTIDGTHRRGGLATVTSLNTGLGDDVLTVALDQGEDGIFVLNTQGPYDNQIVLGVDLTAGDHRGGADDVRVFIDGVELDNSAFTVNFDTDMVSLAPAAPPAVGATVRIEISRASIERFILDSAVTDLALATDVAAGDGVSVFLDGVALEATVDFTVDAAGDTVMFAADVLPEQGAAVTVEVRKMTAETSAISQTPHTDADAVDAGPSTLPLIIFGGQGRDEISGGQGDDIIFGDRGRVLFYDSAADVPQGPITDLAAAEAQAGAGFGHGGPGDRANSVARTHYLALTVDETVGANDTINGGPVVNDSLSDADIIFGGANDSAAGAEELHGNDGDDILLGDHGRVAAIGGAPVVVETTDPAHGGPDVIEGNAGDDLILGGSNNGQVARGDETLLGGEGDDTIHGDFARVLLSAGVVTSIETTTRAHGGDDVIAGGFGADTIYGGPGDDLEYGDNEPGDGDGAAVGTDGPDVFVDGLGDNEIWGLGGVDTLDLSTYEVFYIWDITGLNEGLAHGDLGTVAFHGVENHTGTPDDDRFLFFPGGGVEGLIDGRDGYDTLDWSRWDELNPVTVNRQTRQATGTGGYLAIEQVIGGAGSDRLIGENVDAEWHITDDNAGDIDIPGLWDFVSFENLIGGSQQDVFMFLDGRQVWGIVDGSGGVDLLDYSAYRSTVRVNMPGGWATGVGLGNTGMLSNVEDVLGGAGRDVLVGDDGPNTLRGLSGDDTLRGGGGDDVLDGGTGNDLSDGGAGDDTYIQLPGGTDRLIDPAGRDLLDLSSSPAGVTVNLTLSTGQLQQITDAGDALSIDGVLEDLIATAHADEITGNASANVILGGEGDDELVGLAGADLLDGQGGDDRLDGGTDDDTLRGGAGRDVLIGSTGNDELFGEADDDTLAGDAGDDLLDGGAGNDALDGGWQDDRLFGRAGDDTLTGWYGDDELDGGAGDDVLDGHADNDVLVGGPGDDLLDGNSGRDRVDYSADPAGVTVDLDALRASDGFGGTDTLARIEDAVGSAFDDVLNGDRLPNLLVGGAGDDDLNGGAGNDTLLGQAGDDVLRGEDGNDVFPWSAAVDAGPGADTIDGGAGRDVVELAGSASADEIALDTIDGGVSATVLLPAAARLETLAVEHMRLDLGAGADTVTAALPGGDAAVGVEIHFGAGDDVLAAALSDGSVTAYGDAGDDTFIGGRGSDVLFGGEGHDLLDFSSVAGPVRVRLWANQVDDDGWGSSDTVYEVESVVGTPLADVIEGTAGADVIDGAAGNDTILGHGGNDVLRGGAGNDILQGGPDDDLLEGGPGRDVLFGESGNDELFGGNDDDTLDGGPGDDVLEGQDGNDALDGGWGNDVLQGGAGDDGLDGNAGVDTATFIDSPAIVRADLSTGVAEDGFGGSDTLVGIENLFGSRHADRLTGDEGANVLTGHDGADILIGGPGGDTLIGGTGDDEVFGEAGDDRIIWHSGDGSEAMSDPAGNDVLDVFGSIWNDTIVIGPGAAGVSIDGTSDVPSESDSDGAGDLPFTLDIEGIETLNIHTGRGDDSVTVGDMTGGPVTAITIHLGAGDDSLDATASSIGVRVFGDEGDDTFAGGAGIDTFAGGTGIDTVDYSAAPRGVYVNLTEAWAYADGYGAYDSIGAVESLIGSAFDDTVTGTGGFNRLVGGEGNDWLYGWLGNDILIGGGGNDTLWGSTGNETLLGGPGNDIIRGVWGNNEIDGGPGDDVLSGGTGNDTIHGGEGNDRINMSYGENVIFGDGGDDTITCAWGRNQIDGGEGDDVVHGGSQGDTIRGGAGDDTLNGGGGDDILIGGVGDDTIDGQTGRDVVDYSSSPAAVTVDLGAGTAVDGYGTTDGSIRNVEGIVGSAGDDTLTGGSGDDVIVGFGGDDIIRGGAGQDELAGGAGDDTIFGEAGDDVLVWYASDDHDRIVGGDGTDSLVVRGSVAAESVTAGPGAGAGEVRIDLLAPVSGRVDASEIEAMTLELGGGDDVAVVNDPGMAMVIEVELGEGDDRADASGLALDVTVSGGPGDDVFIGGAGLDWFFGGTGSDTADYGTAPGPVSASLALRFTSEDGRGNSDQLRDVERLVGSGHDDELIGSQWDDVIEGGGGNDVISGGWGNDDLSGGAGNDRLLGQMGDDTLWGGTGDDELFGEQGADGLWGQGGADLLDGGVDDDTLDGGSGGDDLFGGVGNDVLRGGPGDDRLAGGPGDDTLDGQEGDDELLGDGNADTLIGGPGDDILDGDRGDDLLDGRAGNDVLRGADGSDVLEGWTGNDTLTGGPGDDVLTGWYGDDDLSGSAGDDTLAGEHGDDVLAGGEDEDILDAGPQPGSAVVVSSEVPPSAGRKIIDGAGMTGRWHGTDPDDMWLSDGEASPTLLLDLGQRLFISRIRVWNYNAAGDAATGLQNGFRTADMYISTTGVGTPETVPSQWVLAGEGLQFARATGSDDYTGQEITLGGEDVVARFVLFTNVVNWGGNSTGLSEIRLDSPNADFIPAPGTGDAVPPSVEAFGLTSSQTSWALGTIGSAMWTTDRTSQTAPWSILDKLVVTFDEPVTAAVGDLVLNGVDSGVLTPTAVSGSGTNTVTWTLTPAGQYLATDRYVVALGLGVRDLAGNALAGAWAADLNVLPGDINGDGRVSSRDRRELRDTFGSANGDANYTIFADLNGDGRVSSRDLRVLRDGFGMALPDP